MTQPILKCPTCQIQPGPALVEHCKNRQCTWLKCLICGFYGHPRERGRWIKSTAAVPKDGTP